MKETPEVNRTWRINEDLLDKQNFVDQIKKNNNTYFKTNGTPEMKPSILWDAFKAVIRGKLINLNFIIKKNRRKNS